MATKYDVITWGDSAGCGWGDFERDMPGGVPGRLAKDFHAVNLLDKGNRTMLPPFHNNSKYGTTAQQLRGRMRAELEACRREAPILSIVGIGTNDAMRKAKNNHVVVTQWRFAQHMKAVGERALSHNGQLLYIGMTAANPDKVNPYWDQRLVDPERTLRFERIACNVVKKLGGIAIPLYDASMHAGFDEHMVSEDGLHPNSEGYDWIYNRVAPVVHAMWNE
jgi:lysophospholipase L1-like esterase